MTFNVILKTSAEGSMWEAGKQKLGLYGSHCSANPSRSSHCGPCAELGSFPGIILLKVCTSTGSPAEGKEWNTPESCQRAAVKWDLWVGILLFNEWMEKKQRVVQDWKLIIWREFILFRLGSMKQIFWLFLTWINPKFSCFAGCSKKHSFYFRFSSELITL